MLNDVLSLAYALPLIAMTLLIFILNVLASVTMFSVVLNASIAGVFPGITTNAAYLAALALMQVGIWAVYALTLFTWYFKPMSGEGTI
jgi:hypothetical protein